MMLAHLSAPSIPPVLWPLEDCSYCWYLQNPTTPFPEQWSSTICLGHSDWQRQRLVQARAKRRGEEMQGFVLIPSYGVVSSPIEPVRSYVPVHNPAYPTNWKKVTWTIRRLAGNRCEVCQRLHNLSVHHKDIGFVNKPQPALISDKHDIRRENLILLCPACHELADQESRRAQKLARRRIKNQRKTAKKQALLSGQSLALVPYQPE